MSTARARHVAPDEKSIETHAIRRPSALDDSERERAVLTAVLQTIAGWDSFQEGSERLLAELGGALGQIGAALWLPRGETLVAEIAWTVPCTDSAPLARALAELRIPKGAGLAGGAWERREATDRAERAPLERLPRLAESPYRLRATIALPCTVGEEVLGVVELYSTAPLELSAHLMQVLTFAGAGLGAFLARRRGEMRLSPLSPREVQVLVLASQGLSVKGIAEGLTISPATAKTHLEHIYRKLGVRDRAAAVARALRAGFIE
jgi:DNA-binding CsgD family transcriptional regulator